MTHGSGLLLGGRARVAYARTMHGMKKNSLGARCRNRANRTIISVVFANRPVQHGHAEARPGSRNSLHCGWNAKKICRVTLQQYPADCVASACDRSRHRRFFPSKTRAATVEVYLCLAKMVSEMAGLLNSRKKWSEKKAPFFFPNDDSRCASRPSSWDFSSGIISSSFIFLVSKINQFFGWERYVLSSQIEELRGEKKKWGTSIVRSTRPKPQQFFYSAK